MKQRWNDPNENRTPAPTDAAYRPLRRLSFGTGRGEVFA